MRVGLLRRGAPTGRFEARLSGDDGSDEIESRSQDFQRLRHELLEAERNALDQMRRSGAISTDVWLRIGRDLDLERSGSTARSF